MKIVLSSIWYPMSISRFFERAFRRRKDVELVTVGPYTANWIPWNGGMHLPEKYAVAPDVPMAALPTGNSKGPITYGEHLLRQHGIEQWDAWVQVDAGFYFSGKPSQGVNIVVATDPHALNYDWQRRWADVFFCMQTPYMKDGDRYLPYAYDPELHVSSTIPFEDREYDVVMCGLAYPNRIKVVNELRRRGFNVWQGIGPVFEEYVALHHQSRIGFNWSSKEDLCARVFEYAAMGLPVVTNRVPDLERFFSVDNNVWTFETVEQAVDGIDRLLWRDRGEYFYEDAEEWGQNALEAVRGHTWDARVETILDAI